MVKHRLHRKPVIITVATGDDICTVADLLDQCSHHPGRYEVIVQPVRARATASQRGLYRIWLRQLASHIGDSPLDIHKQLTDEFLGLPVMEEGLETMGAVSTGDIQKSPMCEFMTWVQYLAATHYGLQLSSVENIEESSATAARRVPPRTKGLRKGALSSRAVVAQADRIDGSQLATENNEQ